MSPFPLSWGAHSLEAGTKAGLETSPRRSVGVLTACLLSTMCFLLRFPCLEFSSGFPCVLVQSPMSCAAHRCSVFLSHCCLLFPAVVLFWLFQVFFFFFSPLILSTLVCVARCMCYGFWLLATFCMTEPRFRPPTHLLSWPFMLWGWLQSHWLVVYV